MEQIKKMFFTYSGRITRAQYFKWLLLLIAIYFVSGMILFLTWGEGKFVALLYYSIVFFLVSLPAIFSLVIRRLHDFGKSGYYSLLLIPASFIPYLNFVFFLVIGLIPGKPDINKYGAQWVG